MSLLAWLEMALEKLAPNISRIATVAASVASVVASLSWLIAQALAILHRNGSQ